MKVPRSACPSCGELLDASISVEDEAGPKPNDLTICLYCGHVMAFGDGLILRKLTDAEIVKVSGDRRILAIQRARQKLLS